MNVYNLKLINKEANIIRCLSEFYTAGGFIQCFPVTLPTM